MRNQTRKEGKCNFLEEEKAPRLIEFCNLDIESTSQKLDILEDIKNGSEVKVVPAVRS